MERDFKTPEREGGEWNELVGYCGHDGQISGSIRGGGNLINWQTFIHDISISNTPMANPFSNLLVRTDFNSH